MISNVFVFKMTDVETTQNSTTTEIPATPEKKKVSFEMILPDINPILSWLNIEKSRIGLETFKLNSVFIEKDTSNRNKFTRLSNDFQIHQYEDYIYFLEFDLKEQTPENIAKRIFLTHKKGLELRCHYLFDMMSISEMNCDMCLSNMEQFEKLRRINSDLLEALEKKYQKIQKSFDVSFTFEQMQEWKQHLEPITNYFQIIKSDIDKNSQMLISGAVQYEQLKLARVVNRHNYNEAMKYLESFYPE
jgi:hypothetical protein